MAAKQVTCPGCKTTLQLPETMKAGTVKCPKCSMMLAIRAPGSTSTPSPPPPPAKPVDPFAGLPAFQTSGSPRPARGRSAAVGLPPAKPPPRVEYPAAPASQRRSGPTTSRKKRGSSVTTVLAIIGGVGLLGIVICGGVVGVLAYLGSQHSGWEETTFHGYTVKMPPGSRMQEKTTNLPGATIHEHGHQRRETGSQYFLMVSEPLEAQLQRLEVKQILDRSTVLIGNHQEVVRGGVTGIKGTILDGELADAEAEYFFHNGRLIVTAYAPYSKFKQRVGGKRSPRINETELDKPEEFFESLQLP